MVKFYGYNKCSTCKNAQKFLETQKVKFENLALIDNPPKITELKKMLSFLKAEGKDFKSLFNTSGVQYRELGIAEQIKNVSIHQLIGIAKVIECL